MRVEGLTLLLMHWDEILQEVIVGRAKIDSFAILKILHENDSVAAYHTVCLTCEEKPLLGYDLHQSEVTLALKVLRPETRTSVSRTLEPPPDNDAVEVSKIDDSSEGTLAGCADDPGPVEISLQVHANEEPVGPEQSNGLEEVLGVDADIGFKTVHCFLPRSLNLVLISKIENANIKSLIE